MADRDLYIHCRYGNRSIRLLLKKKKERKKEEKEKLISIFLARARAAIKLTRSIRVFHRSPIANCRECYFAGVTRKITRPFMQFQAGADDKWKLRFIKFTPD